MGIYDRDYARPAGGGFGGGMRGSGGPRSWTVNTWLIVICIAIFMLNSLLPQSFIVQGNWVPAPGVVLPVESPKALPLKSLSLGELPEGKPFKALEPTAVPVFYASTEGEKSVVGYQPVVIHGTLYVWGYFSTAKALVSTDATWGLVGFEFWRFLTFQFLHSEAGLSHLLFNMIGLFFFGAIVEQFLGRKRYLAFYLLCGMAGACMYLLLNFLGLAVSNLAGVERFPFLLFDNPNTQLVGASAGVFGVIMAAAYLMPEAKVLLFFVIPMKLKTLAYGLVGMAIIAVFFQWEGSNAGGEAAHIGGAIAGFYFVRKPHQLHGFFDFLGRFDPTSKSNKARKGGSVRKSPGGMKRKIAEEAEVDRILDKIHAKGLQSLSAKEKELLREASRR